MTEAMIVRLEGACDSDVPVADDRGNLVVAGPQNDRLPAQVGRNSSE
jgi:hypothetical protein